jgi:hypothetical protein
MAASGQEIGVASGRIGVAVLNQSRVTDLASSMRVRVWAKLKGESWLVGGAGTT